MKMLNGSERMCMIGTTAFHPGISIANGEAKYPLKIRMDMLSLVDNINTGISDCRW